VYTTLCGSAAAPHSTRLGKDDMFQLLILVGVKHQTLTYWLIKIAEVAQVCKRDASSFVFIYLLSLFFNRSQRAECQIETAVSGRAVPLFCFICDRPLLSPALHETVN